jgi:ABC-type amino acid transport system permease subunit
MGDEGILMITFIGFFVGFSIFSMNWSFSKIFENF